ncbi:DUF6171 family protein [Enterococcus sp. LJL90]
MACRGCNIQTEVEAADVASLIAEQLALEINLIHPEIAEQRKTICEACPFRFKETCSKCGCFYEFRANLANKDCPAGFWK